MQLKQMIDVEVLLEDDTVLAKDQDPSDFVTWSVN